MGAGQIGGIATLLDIDFNNAPGFLGHKTDITEGQHIVYYLSHAMMFCVGALIEAHVVLTPAGCVFGERYKFDVFGATHRFLEGMGVSRTVEHMCLHRGYNHSSRWFNCSSANLALLVLGDMYSFHSREQGSEFVVNRVRYGIPDHKHDRVGDTSCRYYGWGSRRNGYLIPLLIDLRRVDVTILHEDACATMWDNEDNFLCIQQPPCKSEDYGAICPDDMGSVVICSGFAHGMMTSRLVDRPCGVGFVDLAKFNKFLTCGVDDSRDVIDAGSDDMSFDFTTESPRSTISLITPPKIDDDDDEKDTKGEENKEKEKEEENKDNEKEEEKKDKEKEEEKKEKEEEKEDKEDKEDNMGPEEVY